MANNFFLSFLFCLQISNSCSSKPMPKFMGDSTKGKNGFFHKCNHSGCTDAYYINDTLNGVFKYYGIEKGESFLNIFGFYTKGEPTGTWYYFDPSGYFFIEETNFKEHHGSYKKDGVTIYYKFESYVKEYYPNGKCKQEGIARYDEDIQLDYNEFGSWKRYDKDGKLLKKGIKLAQ